MNFDLMDLSKPAGEKKLMDHIVWISFQTVRKSLRREDLLSTLQQEAETWCLNSMANITTKWITRFVFGQRLLTVMHDFFAARMIHYDAYVWGEQFKRVWIKKITTFNDLSTMKAEHKLRLGCSVGNLHHKHTRIGEGKRWNLSCTACMEQILPASGVGLSSTLLYNIYTPPPSAEEHTHRAQTNTNEQVYTQREEVDGGGYTCEAGGNATQHMESCYCSLSKLVLPSFCLMDSTGQRRGKKGGNEINWEGWVLSFHQRAALFFSFCANGLFILKLHVIRVQHRDYSWHKRKLCLKSYKILDVTCYHSFG